VALLYVLSATGNAIRIKNQDFAGSSAEVNRHEVIFIFQYFIPLV